LSTKTPNLGLNGNIDPCETGIISKINENIQILDAIVNAGIIDFVADEASLPVSPTTGDSYIATDTGNLFYYTTEWKSIPPLEGFRVYDKNQDKLLAYNGTSWVPLTASAENIGAGEVLFAQVDPVSGNLQFKSLVAGGGIVLTSGPDTITVTNSNSSFIVDPYAVSLSNPQFEADTASWTFTPNPGSGNTFARSTVDPLSGNASGQIDISETSVPIFPTREENVLETTFTLAGGVQVGQTIRVEFDYQVDGAPTGFGNYDAILRYELREVTGNALVKQSDLSGLGPGQVSGIPIKFVDGEPTHVCIDAEAISTETDYKLLFIISETFNS